MITSALFLFTQYRVSSIDYQISMKQKLQVKISSQIFQLAYINICHRYCQFVYLNQNYCFTSLLMLFAKSAQTNRYRSVKYKLNRDSSMSSQFEQLQKKKSSTPAPKYSTFKGRRHPSGFSALNITEIKKNKSEINDDNPEQQKHKRSTYVDTFHFLLSMEKNKHNSVKKQQQEEKTLKKQSLSRIQLPSLNELDSNFTVLDNIHLPINYINEGIDKLNEQLKNDSVELVGIKTSLKQIHKARIKEIEDIQKFGERGIRKLKDLLKTVRVAHQQSILKLKSSYEKCIDYLPEYQQKLQQSKDRLLQLQGTIFQNEPFQLKQSQEFEMVSPAYF